MRESMKMDLLLVWGTTTLGAERPWLSRVSRGGGMVASEVVLVGLGLRTRFTT